ncbi:hypothetical protein KJ855_04700 [Patescibacteria group bacterium]|nr:hypothetical protein [Patescibacteria group bacterium]
MTPPERQKMLIDVFAPKKDEKILILLDVPKEGFPDNQPWQGRRQMAREWQETFEQINQEQDLNLTIDLKEFPTIGQHNYYLPDDILELIRQYHIILSMSEYSYTTPLKAIIKEPNNISRIASMPGIEKRMEESAISADYTKVKKYANALKNILNEAAGAEIEFSTNDKLFVDLRFRQNAIADDGDYTTSGSSGNFPAGEGFITPYEAAGKEKEKFGPSQTKGTMPFLYDKELVKYIIEENNIIDVIGDGPKATEMKKYFAENNTRRNIAELGLGCNPDAEITGNLLEDEKAGLHIAYGTSSHFGGRVTSDTHWDLVFSKGCPIEGTTVTLIKEDGSRITVIENAKMKYEFLETI